MSRSLVRRLVCAVLCVCSFAAQAAAQSTLSGTVYGGSSPLANTLVEALNDGTTTVVASSTTDGSGRYSMALANATYDLRVTPAAGSGYGTETVQNVTVSGDRIYDVILLASGSGKVSGTVVGYGGNPVANANVTVYTNSWQWLASGVTDAEGRYTFAVSGTVHIGVGGGWPASPHAPQSWSAWRYNVAVSGATVVDFALPVVKVSGQVTTEAGTGVASASVSAYGGGSASNTYFDGSGSAVTDGSGRYAMLLMKGSNNFTVRPPNGSTLTPITANAALSGDTTRDFVLPAAVLLSGIVTGYGGHAIANANVTVYTSGGQWIASTQTDSNGKYSVAASTGAVHVAVGGGWPASPYAPQSWSAWRYNVAVSGATVVDFALPVVKVSGQVTTEAGSGVASASVSAYGGESSAGSYFDGSGSTVTASSGSYSMLLMKGSNNFTVRPPNGSTLTPMTVNVPLSADAIRDFVLRPAVLISGLVTGYEGYAIANANVTVYTSGWQWIASTQTDSNGKYSVAASTGAVHVGVGGGWPASPYAPQSWSAWRYNVAVSGPRAVDFRLPVAAIDGSVTDSNGAPVPNVSVSGYGSGSDSAGYFDGSNSAASDPNGKYRMLFMRSNVNLTVRPPNQSGFQPTALNIAIRGDLTQRIVLQKPDLSPPQITAGPFVVHLSDTSVSISWTTNEASSSVVQYGVDGLTQTASTPGLVTNHTVTLLNLREVTTYQFRAASNDQVGNGPTYSGVGTFSTQAAPGDITSPVFRDGPTVVFADQTSAIVQWGTDEPASSLIEFGLTPSFGSSVAGIAGVFTQSHSLTLTRLAPETTYYAQVTSADPDGNSSTSSVFRITTLGAPDTAAPVISAGPTVESITDTTISVSWTTDEPATSGVSFNDGVRFEVISDSTLTKTHRMTLSGLQPSTVYQITVSSTDAVGNGPTLGGPIAATTAATPDTTIPEISNVQITEVSTNSVVVSWTTNEVATSTVAYGIAAGAPDNARTELTAVTGHSLTLTGLREGTTYYFVVASTDASGNSAVSVEMSFKTESSFVDQPPTAPGPITAPGAPTRAESFEIVWGASTDDVALDRYEVIRNGSVVAVVAPGTTTHVESGLADGTYTYQLRATDSAGHTAESGTVSVTVDRTAPEITVPGDLSASTVGRTAVVEYAASVIDLIDPAVTVSCSPASGAAFPVGKTLVVCGATDSAGNSATASFSVTVADAAPPTVTVPSDLTIEATSVAGAIAQFAATADDLVDGPLTPACTVASGSTFPLGTTPVRCDATDAAGNTGSATFNVRVVDTTAPKIASVAPSQALLWPPNHQMVPLSVRVSVADVADAAPICTVAGITSNEPVNGTGDGDTGPDWEIGGGLTFALRAERAGSGNGRLYTITVQCSDASGNSTSGTTTVGVPKSQGRR